MPSKIRQFAHGPRIEDIPRDPVQRLQIAQPAAAFLDVRLDNERAVAVAAMAHRPFGLFGRDILGSARFLAGGPEAAMKFAE